MRRYHSIQSSRKRKSRKKEIKRYIGSTDSEWYQEVVSRNNFDSRSWFDCGRKNCVCCHWEKITGTKTKKQKIADIQYKEQLQEFFGDIGYAQEGIEWFLEISRL